MKTESQNVEAENRVELGERVEEPHVEIAGEKSKKLVVVSAEKDLQEWCSQLILPFLAVVCIIQNIVASIAQSGNVQVGTEAINEQTRRSSMEVITQQFLKIKAVVGKVQESLQMKSDPASIANRIIPISQDAKVMIDETCKMTDMLHTYQSEEKMMQAKSTVEEEARKLRSVEKSSRYENTKEVEAEKRALEEAKRALLKLTDEGVPQEENVAKYHKELELAVENLNTVGDRVIAAVSWFPSECGDRVQLRIRQEKENQGAKHVDGETMNQIEADFLQMGKWTTEADELALGVKKGKNLSFIDLATKLKAVILTAAQAIQMEQKIMTQIDGFQARENKRRLFMEAEETGKKATNAAAEAMVAEIEYGVAMETRKGVKEAKAEMEKKQTAAKLLKERAAKEAAAINEVEELEKLREELEKEREARKVAEARIKELEKVEAAKVETEKALDLARKTAKEAEETGERVAEAMKKVEVLAKLS
jgi:hypothetical protein